MKLLNSSLLMMFIAITLFSCSAQTSENEKSENVISENVQVFYFHNTKRCVTCNAVETETKIALEMFYEDNMKAGAIDFTALNLEEDEGKDMAQSLGVSGQTLLIVKGETQVNLTNEGFLNARVNPTEFHEILKTQIDKLL
jgi:hypothetical protein